MEVVGKERRQTQQTFGGKRKGWFVGTNKKGGVKMGPTFLPVEGSKSHRDGRQEEGQVEEGGS